MKAFAALMTLAISTFAVESRAEDYASRMDAYSLVHFASTQNYSVIQGTTLANGDYPQSQAEICQQLGSTAVLLLKAQGQIIKAGLSDNLQKAIANNLAMAAGNQGFCSSRGIGKISAADLQVAEGDYGHLHRRAKGLGSGLQALEKELNR